jgi:hypothetical protein
MALPVDVALQLVQRLFRAPEIVKTRWPLPIRPRREPATLVSVKYDFGDSVNIAVQVTDLNIDPEIRFRTRRNYYPFATVGYAKSRQQIPLVRKAEMRCLTGSFKYPKCVGRYAGETRHRESKQHPT